MVRYLGERAHREHLSGLVPVLAAAGPNLPEPVDIVLVVDTYHHIENRTSYFAKLKDALVPNGRAAIVDFKVDAPEGPPPKERVPPEKPSRNSTLLAIRWLPPIRSCRGSISSCFSRRGRDGARSDRSSCLRAERRRRPTSRSALPGTSGDIEFPGVRHLDLPGALAEAALRLRRPAPRRLPPEGMEQATLIFYQKSNQAGAACVDRQSHECAFLMRPARVGRHGSDISA